MDLIKIGLLRLLIQALTTFMPKIGPWPPLSQSRSINRFQEITIRQEDKGLINYQNEKKNSFIYLDLNNSLTNLYSSTGKIMDRFFLHALDRYWHNSCLKCSCCHEILADMGSSCFTRSNMILCKSDYSR